MFQEKQEVAQALSSHINHAYQTLLDPLARAEYILSRNHVPISEGDQVHDMSFMAEIMEAREAIDDAGSPEEVRSLLEENEGEHRTRVPVLLRRLTGVADKIAEVLAELERLIGGSSWGEAKAAAIRLKYLQGIQRAAKRWLDNH